MDNLVFTAHLRHEKSSFCSIHFILFSYWTYVSYLEGNNSLLRPCYHKQLLPDYLADLKWIQMKVTTLDFLFWSLSPCWCTSLPYLKVGVPDHAYFSWQCSMGGWWTPKHPKSFDFPINHIFTTFNWTFGANIRREKVFGIRFFCLSNRLTIFKATYRCQFWLMLEEKIGFADIQNISHRKIFLSLSSALL